ncbi:hypothetical protein GDO86_020625 [Hymenochirus boettgeri]|uniref:Uncharacterized protein n=1 Tax=Hymenochirus boettgeri TaxID=247094 RepID=A0A8T2IH85_9PIPI|nr:hypothetical protein GDO86_020625 [Hymenochirus boettgeri]
MTMFRAPRCHSPSIFQLHQDFLGQSENSLDMGECAHLPRSPCVSGNACLHLFVFLLHKLVQQ